MHHACVMVIQVTITTFKCVRTFHSNCCFQAQRCSRLLPPPFRCFLSAPAALPILGTAVSGSSLPGTEACWAASAAVCCSTTTSCNAAADGNSAALMSRSGATPGCCCCCCTAPSPQHVPLLAAWLSAPLAPASPSAAGSSGCLASSSSLPAALGRQQHVTRSTAHANALHTCIASMAACQRQLLLTGVRPASEQLMHTGVCSSCMPAVACDRPPVKLPR